MPKRTRPARRVATLLIQLMSRSSSKAPKLHTAERLHLRTKTFAHVSASLVLTCHARIRSFQLPVFPIRAIHQRVRVLKNLQEQSEMFQPRPTFRVSNE